MSNQSGEVPAPEATQWVHATDEDHKRAVLARAETAKAFSDRRMRLSRLTLGLSMDAETLHELELGSSPERYRMKYLAEKESYYRDRARVLGGYAASMTVEAPTLGRARSWLLRKRQSYHEWRAERAANKLSTLGADDDHVLNQPFEPRMTSILTDVNDDGPLAVDVMERITLPDGRVVLTGSGPVPRD